MTEKELEGAKKLIENKEVKKGSYSYIGDSNITYADIKILLDYIKQLEEEYQKYKEAIDKLELLLEDLKLNKKKEEEEGKSYFNTDLFAIRVKEILKILKELG